MPDDRTYIRVHDGLPDHPKVEGLSDAAFRLLVTTWCWCSRHLTDGQIPTKVWLKRGTSKTRRELVDAGLVEVEGEVEVHDYLEHQRSAAEVEALKEKRRESGRKGGKASASARANGQAKSKQVVEQVVEPKPSKTQPSTETEVVPKTTSSGGEPPIGKQSVDVGAVVAAWIEGAQEATGERPASRLVGQVGRQAKELALEGRWDQGRLVAAAHDAGAKGFADLPRELMRAAVGSGSGRPAGVRPSEEWMDA